MLPQVHIFLVYIFSDKIFGIQYSISFTFIIYLGTKSQYHKTRQAKALVVLLLVLDVSSFWGPVEWLSERGALHPQQVSPQISIFFKSEFHKEINYLLAQY